MGNAVYGARAGLARTRRAGAVSAAKLSAVASRLLGRGGGTALPGVIATALDPNLVRDLGAQLGSRTLVVSGTNGKTTTSRMLDTMLRDAGYLPVRNESGSNLMRGLAASLIQRAGIHGNLIVASQSVGLFEVDEAALPDVLTALIPGTLLLLNLFRDQLDRYGEVATVARLWSTAVQRLQVSTRVVANADDPLVTTVTSAGTQHAVFFGIESIKGEARIAEHASDVKACPRCGGPIIYDTVFLGHLGHYTCSNCDLTRPRPDVYSSEIGLNGVHGSTFRLTTPSGSSNVTLPLPGLYNIYNATAAAAAAHVTGVSVTSIAHSLSHVTAAFGRMERLEVQGKRIFLALAKNPAGLNEILRTIISEDQPVHLMMMLNDNTADGRDVSWIWDADVEMLNGHVASVVFSGIRANDMAVRFKYAGVIRGDMVPSWEVVPETQVAFRHALENTPGGGLLFIVPTYTAMLDIRSTLARLGYVKPYWEE